MQQLPAIIKLIRLLTRYYRDAADVFLDGGGFIAYDRNDGNRRVSPDLYIAFGVDGERIFNTGNYFLWEVGKPPDFAMEVASDSTAANDLGFKRELYAELGIAEYWRFDPTGGERYGEALVGERLVDGEYHAYELHTADDGSVWSRSEVLDLQFHWLSWASEIADAFDIRDPRTGRTIDMEVLEREARLAADAAEARERELRLAADAAEAREREARLAADAAEARERELRLAAEARERELRLAAEARERELLAEIERLRARQGE